MTTGIATAKARDAASPLPAENPVWFFRFFVIYTCFTLVSLGLLYAAFFFDLTAPDPRWGSVAYRLFVGFVLVPAGLLVAVLVLRHTRRNVTGLFLIMHATAVMQSSLAFDSPFQAMSGLFNNAWLGLWLLPLYFPDGAVYPKRLQRWIRIYTIFMSVLFATSFLYYPTAEFLLPGGRIVWVPNPLRAPVLDPIAGLLEFLQSLTWIGTVLFIIPSIILRYRASEGRARQQIKLFVWAFTLYTIIFLIILSMGDAESSVDRASRLGVFAPLIIFYEAVIFPAIPFAVIGYAILRHRLYDIDVIIRRTAAYSVVTALLGGVYFGAVTLLQELFSRLVGSESPLAIVISTLTIAALFTPLRNRVQQTVDRVFYRRKYDAETIIDQFGESLRDEMDVEHLQDALFGVVMETMQPEYVGLWLKSEKP